MPTSEDSVSGSPIPTDQTPELDRERGEDYYTSNHTEYRPPHLNYENFPSTQPNGSNTQPRQAWPIQTYSTMREPEHVMHDSNDNYTHHTARADDPSIARPYLAYILSQNYGSYGGAGGSDSRLTMQAIANHNYNTGNGYYGWQYPSQVGGYNNLYVDDYDESTGHIMLSSRSGSQASMITDDYVPIPSTSEDPSVELCYTGSWHDGTATPRANIEEGDLNGACGDDSDNNGNFDAGYGS
ncbi:hypothetical protein ABKA04_006533 [Annulohypoxylon sp. FPYF3050]